MKLRRLRSVERARIGGKSNKRVDRRAGGKIMFSLTVGSFS